MAEASVGRALRDGSLEGEHAAALSLKDSLACPFGAPLFSHFLRGLATNVSAGRSPARGLVLVAFDCSPSFYVDFLKGGGSSCVDSTAKWFRVLDCYSDPLGWKKHPSSSFLQGGGNGSLEELRTVFRDVKDLDKLCSLVLDLGRGLVGEGKGRFAIAIDSISTLLRHASLPSVASLISNLRAHSQVSTIFWLIHSDLHESRVCAALDYLSTMVAILEQRIENSRGEKGVLSIQHNFYGGRFHLRLKRRNGRVKILYEDFHVEQGGIKFSELSSENKLVNQTLLPKVQFNLQLSEKERIDRANTIHIYDGRRSHQEAQKDPHPTTLPAPGISEISKNMGGGKGEIHYLRDSDDEMPDSDEDPDDDLDI
ncbi:hypothetical protein Taro_033940 [Colocasia esculenta]|uniref:Elongator complex protein 5 n=1 Tax=Colocasia esculenta TaxID=4460 RepID=A0A843WE04_COLES|nr:hypothetical protein [Colocasia esculenta]